MFVTFQQIPVINFDGSNGVLSINVANILHYQEGPNTVVIAMNNGSYLSCPKGSIPAIEQAIEDHNIEVGLRMSLADFTGRNPGSAAHMSDLNKQKKTKKTVN